MSTAPPPDRYVQAVLARRAELRELRGRAAGGHRTALRDALACAMAETAAAADAARAELRREAAAHVAGPAPRALVTLLPAAVHAVEEHVRERWTGAAGAAVRRTAAERGLRVPAGWPSVPPLPPTVLPAPPPRAGPGVALADPTVWRFAALPLVLVPSVVALGWATAGPGLLFPVAGAALLALVGLVRWRRAAAERARMRRWVDEVLAAARCDTARAATVLAAAAGSHLDVALDRHRSALEFELTLLTTGPSDG